MRKGLGFGCIALGLVCILLAVGLVVHNHYEDKSGGQASQMLLQAVQMKMEEGESAKPEKQPAESLPPSIQETFPSEMPTVPAGEYESIGILTIPALEIELPVLTDWDYEKLEKAPCHYYGSYYGTDFVIAAHNYISHFRKLSELQPEDLVLFTDVTGQVHCYEVVLLETLPPTATEAMITSGFDMSLYTCTPGGASRVTVRCKAISGQ